LWEGMSGWIVGRNEWINCGGGMNG
jgi:hypothetical protein